MPFLFLFSLLISLSFAQRMCHLSLAWFESFTFLFVVACLIRFFLESFSNRCFLFNTFQLFLNAVSSAFHLLPLNEAVFNNFHEFANIHLPLHSAHQQFIYDKMRKYIGTQTYYTMSPNWCTIFFNRFIRFDAIHVKRTFTSTSLLL